MERKERKKGEKRGDWINHEDNRKKIDRESKRGKGIDRKRREDNVREEQIRVPSRWRWE